LVCRRLAPTPPADRVEPDAKPGARPVQPLPPARDLATRPGLVCHMTHFVSGLRDMPGLAAWRWPGSGAPDRPCADCCC